MTPELQKQLAELLAALMNIAGDAAKWTGTQVPPLVHEKIIYGRIEHTCYAVLFGVVAWLAARRGAASYTRADADTSKGGDFDFWLERRGAVQFALCSVLSAGLAIAAVNHADYALMAFFAPRLFIVEWLRSMM